MFLKASDSPILDNCDLFNTYSELWDYFARYWDLRLRVLVLDTPSLVHHFSKNDTDNFENWYGLCFEPMSPPPISLEELLPSLLVYRCAHLCN